MMCKTERKEGREEGCLFLSHGPMRLINTQIVVHKYSSIVYLINKCCATKEKKSTFALFAKRNIGQLFFYR